MRELFLGNGVIGMMAYVASTDNFVTFWIGRPDVTDHRKAPDRKISMGIKGASVVTDYCRLDVGKFKLYPDSEILSGTMSLDIYNGEIIGRIQTASGVLALRTYTPRIYNVNIVEVEYGLNWREDMFQEFLFRHVSWSFLNKSRKMAMWTIRSRFAKLHRKEAVVCIH